ncbi:hypothetical protein HY380_01935 [Candidatus Saccharibacteria bacterium]|nr:hypothetical protein [Candidatus Saccharibacteria bacterium]
MDSLPTSELAGQPPAAEARPQHSPQPLIAVAGDLRAGRLLIALPLRPWGLIFWQPPIE